MIAGYLKGFCVICALRKLIDASLFSETGVVSPWTFVNNLNCILLNFVCDFGIIFAFYTRVCAFILFAYVFVCCYPRFIL